MMSPGAAAKPVRSAAPLPLTLLPDDPDAGQQALGDRDRVVGRVAIDQDDLVHFAGIRGSTWARFSASFMAGTTTEMVGIWIPENER